MAYYKDYDDKNDFEFDDDLGLSEYEQARFDAFIDWLADLEREYYSEQRVFVIDIKKFQDLKKSWHDITKFIKKIDSNAKITYENCDTNELFMNRHAEIIIEMKDFCIKDVKNFIDSIKLSSYISFIPTLSNTIKIYIGFKNIIKEMIG